MKASPPNPASAAKPASERSKVTDNVTPTSARKGKRMPSTRISRGERSPYAESLMETCASNPRLQSFSLAIGVAGLGDLLKADGPLTIFAPTDRAFEKIPDSERSALMGDAPRLAELVRHHLVTGRVKAPNPTTPRTVTSQAGIELELTASTQGFHVDEARIVKTNIRATNGVIHAIDTVLGVG